jgi:hypothetical protein
LQIGDLILEKVKGLRGERLTQRQQRGRTGLASALQSGQLQFEDTKFGLCVRVG